MMEAKVRSNLRRGLNTKLVCTDTGGKHSHAIMVHDLQSDARITVVKLAKGSYINIPTAPVHDQDPAAVDLVRVLPLSASTPSETDNLPSKSVKTIENAEGRDTFHADA